MKMLRSMARKIRNLYLFGSMQIKEDKVGKYLLWCYDKETFDSVLDCFVKNEVLSTYICKTICINKCRFHINLIKIKVTYRQLLFEILPSLMSFGYFLRPGTKSIKTKYIKKTIFIRNKIQ